jgi:hypothetical protein
MTLPVAPALFDVLTQYAKDIEQGKVKPSPSMGATSPALTFCENFYAQFFQNRLGQQIKRFDLAAKKTAIGLRLKLKGDGGPTVIIQLITWYEKLCDIYSSVLALGYGGGSRATFLDFHENYLLTLLERASAWAKFENFPDIEQKATSTLSEIKKALQSIPK